MGKDDVTRVEDNALDVKEPRRLTNMLYQLPFDLSGRACDPRSEVTSPAWLKPRSGRYFTSDCVYASLDAIPLSLPR
jgi:hypothetical protein